MIRSNRWFLAVFPSLIQLFATLSESFKQVLNLSSLFFKPDLLPILNSIAFICSLSVITYVSTILNSKPIIQRKPNKVVLKIRAIFYEEEKISIFDPKKERRFYLHFLFPLELIALFIFIYVSVTKDPTSGLIFTFLQSASYILSLSFFAGLIYIWTSNQIEQDEQFKPEKFIPNFQEALVKYGIINTQLTILGTRSTQEGYREVDCKINGEPKKLHVSFNGTEILKVVAD